MNNVCLGPEESTIKVPNIEIIPFIYFIIVFGAMQIFSKTKSRVYAYVLCSKSKSQGMIE